MVHRRFRIFQDDGIFISKVMTWNLEVIARKRFREEELRSSEEEKELQLHLVYSIFHVLNLLFISFSRKCYQEQEVLLILKHSL